METRFDFRVVETIVEEILWNMQAMVGSVHEEECHHASVCQSTLLNLCSLMRGAMNVS